MLSFSPEGYSDLPLTHFAKQLFGNGQVVSHGQKHLQEPEAEDLRRADEVLQMTIPQIGCDVPGGYPNIDPAAAMTGLMTMAWAAAVYLDRLIDHVAMPAWLVDRQPGGDHGDVALDAGIDVAGRLMADLRRRISDAGPDDPLLIELDAWMSRWPLVCVGSHVQPDVVAWDRVMNHPGLKRVITDRIVLRRDASMAGRDDVAVILKRERIG